MLKNLMLSSFAILFIISCSYQKSDVFRGCGFSLNIPPNYTVEEMGEGNMDYLLYKILDDKNEIVLLINVGNTPRSPRFEGLSDSLLTSTYRMVDFYVDQYGYYGSGRKTCSMIFGSKENEFPMYVQFLYTAGKSSKIDQIIHSLKIEKDNAKSKLCMNKE